MVSQWGARKVRSSKVRLNVQDRISQTDNSVMICNVLSRLPTKDAVKTIVFYLQAGEVSGLSLLVGN